MALESNGKIHNRNSFGYAGGDNHFQTHNETSNFEDYHVNVEMVEGGSIAEHQIEKRYFGGLVGTKELFIMSSLAVCMYLVNGEYAQSVCTALTSVPPAVFSYRVLINRETTKQGYHTILFYWTLYGLVALIDQFVGTAQGYNLCKGGLLSVVFFHAVRSNSTAIPPSWNFMEKVSTDIITTIFSQYENILINNTSGFDPKTPTMTEFSDGSSEYIFPDSDNYQNVDMVNSTAISFQPSLEMQTTQRGSTGFGNKTRNQVSSLKTMQLHGDDSTSRASNPNSSGINFESMSAMTMTTSGHGDIVIVPVDHITFTNDNREKNIQITNVSPLHIMFALKTNADTYLIAAPTSGILLSGQTVTIRIGVTENYYNDLSDPGVSIDKLALDYTSIPASSSTIYSKFSPQFFQSQNRQRLAIRVFYQ